MLNTTAPKDLSRREILARLNDRCRHGLDRNARTVMTRTCLGTFAGDSKVNELVAQAQILAAIRKFVYPADDRSEHDRGQIEYQGHTVYFAIDAYDTNLEYGSPDPADASVSRRVMTIMMRDDL
ncbi:hypothetical protein B2G71_19675 [Novosphingobium sp. PC22D]|jgi:hypothetical protein|uniref:DUF3768 domain-containing protein n=2 Tax=Novosphingobium TaxID=165696 RepID=A0ABQ2JU11_9SPHN|nr:MULTISPECIES: DUF3768 domain-containing protein [Novosphingobium]MCJ2180170.1 DUF3768 domain-containing protein [Novosphingobium album (ex Hu et al. 2023)]PEQ11030.1 hypothetical protein B2G71_19675 [Novosphingobium sp. PC22D]GGN55609.1 hypothetical protein GCM10011349_32450 [Novosphingobium indicum]